jgi:hypothetical protein
LASSRVHVSSNPLVQFQAYSDEGFHRKRRR